jgi:toxin FitB
MLLLDTNVLSALMARERPAAIAHWLAAQPAALLCTASICRAEILAGLEIMPPGRRRSDLEEAAVALFADDLRGRVLPFNSTGADIYARVLADRRRSGRPTAPVDLIVAATAVSHDADIVTRNVRDFDGCGVAVINPWDE